MATTTTNFGWDIPQSTDLVKDGATAIATLGQDIDTALVDLKGGTTGQLLSKNSNTDLDYTWVNPSTGDITGVTAGTGISGGGTSGDVTITNSMATAIDAKGDLIAGTGADAFSRLAVGANNTVLTADSSTATGLKWATPSSGMTLISRARYTGASTYNVDNVLSTTYSNYLIVLENVYLDAGAKMTMALRYGTSTQTSLYKYSTFGWKYSGITWNNGSSASASNVVVAGPGYISSSFFNLTIENTGWVSFSGTSANADDGSFAFGGLLYNVSQTWTGLQFSNTNAGTLNADISIYGRAK